MTPAHEAGTVEAAVALNHKLDRVIDTIRDWQRANLACAMPRSRKADDFNQLTAQWHALRLLGQAMETDFAEQMEVIAHELRTYHDHCPVEGMAWSDVPVPLSVVRVTAGMVS